MDKQEILNRLDISNFYAGELSGVNWNGKDTTKALCCFHEDTNPSLSINQKTGFFNCFACGIKGSVFDFAMKKHGLDFTGAMALLAERAGIVTERRYRLEQIKKQEPEGLKYDRHHVYESGKPVYVRAIYKKDNKKTGRYFTLVADNVYIPGRKSKPVLYNQEMLSQEGQVCFPEGEKDCNTLEELGFCAVTNGSAKDPLTPEILEPLRGLAILIFQDNDIPGREAALKKAEALRDMAASVKVIELPGLPEKGDVSDWVAARQAEGKTVEGINVELRQIVKAAPEWQEPEAAEPAEGKQRGRLNLTGIADMLNSEPVKYLIDRILIKDTLTMLSAYAATGKSILSLAIAKAILTGNNLFDSLNVSETGPVLVIDEENPAAFIKERLEGFGFTADMPLHFLHYQGVKLDNDSLFDELAEVIKDIKPKLIIIDSLIRIHSQKENEAGMSSVMGKLRELVQTGATVLVIHHHRKGAGDIKEGIRGHSDIIGGVDMAITLEQKEDYLLLSYAKSRTVSHEPIRLELQASGGILSYKCLGNESSEIIEVILSLLKEKPEGMKQTEILKAIKETGDLDYGDKKIRQTLRSGEAVYWDSQKGGHTGKAIIYRVKNVMRQCGNTIYRETLPHYKKDPAALEGNESLQTLDNTKCGNAAESVKTIATLSDNPANSKKELAALETDDTASIFIDCEVE